MNDNHLKSTSTGHALSAAAWLDTHYLAGQPEYEAMLRSAGFQRGWRVLDAGCGGGNYLPLLAELLGATGQISALDLAPENVNQVESLLVAGGLHCPADVRLGDVTALPFAANAFDAVWSANVTQYLPDPELHTMLTEARRVLKPGGLVAIKDTEDSALSLHPVPPWLLWRIFDALARRGEMTIIGGLRGLHLSQFVKQGGFTHVRRTVVYIERQQPLRTVEAQMIAELVGWLAQAAETLDLPAADRTQWRAFADPASPGYILHQPDLYWREADVLVTGFKL
jgi:ubiquinone/menaquinone biosynthesis C-methylase UbiE